MTKSLTPAAPITVPAVKIGDTVKPWSKGPKVRIGDAVKPF